MKICCVGDNCIDYYKNDDVAKAGGNPVNVAVYIKQLGGDSSYVGAVGTDEFGEIIINELKKQGVDVSNIQINEGTTAVTEVEIKDNERILGDYSEGVMENFKLTKENMEFIKSHNLVVSGYWGNVHDRFKEFKELGLKTAFDFATNTSGKIIEETLPYVDYAFFSDDELNEKEILKFMKKAHLYGPELVIVTKGERGSICYDGDKFYEYGIIEAPVVDTLGAGDSYIAGFLYSLMNNKAIEESMEAGAKRASITIGYDGAW